MLYSSLLSILLALRLLPNPSSTCLKPKSLLIAFRPESRHTGGFSSVTPYALPRLEFLSCCKAAKFKPLRVSGESITNWFVLEGVEAADALAAVQRCVLAHSLYETWGVGSSTSQAAEDLRTFLQNDSTPNIQSYFKTLGLSTFDAEKQVGTAVNVKAQAFADFAAAMSLRGSFKELKLLDETTGLVENVVFSLNFRTVIGALSIYGRRLAHGPAADPKGSMAVTRRRPNAGILARFALSRRKAHVSTSMEPELAFVMANLARVGASETGCVMDPFCGSCALLLCAADLVEAKSQDGNRKDVSYPSNGILIGFDANAFTLDKDLAGAVEEDFERLGLNHLILKLSTENIHNWRHHFLALPSLQSIVTDPPYGVKAAHIEPGKEAATASSSKSRESFEFSELQNLYASLLDLAASKLQLGGRLVLFVPEPFSPEATGALMLIRPLPPQLRLVHVATQVFRGSRRSRLDARISGSLGSHFRRSLVVLEKQSS
jgi:tRNA G10  N-methylase Trm11